MESLLRTVLTSPSDLSLPTKVDNVQQNRSSQTTSPYLHAALTTALRRDLRTEQSHNHSTTEQTTVPPTAAGSDGRVPGEHESNRMAGEGVGTIVIRGGGGGGIDGKKPPSLISNRHSKLLEALTSDFRLPDSHLQVALTTPLPLPLPTSLKTTAPSAPPPPPLTSNSVGSSTDPNLNSQSNAAPYKSKLFLALTSPLEHWDKDPACSKGPNFFSDSNKKCCPGNKTSNRTVAAATETVGKTIKKENITGLLDASPAWIEPKNFTSTIEAKEREQCFQYGCSSDATKSELSEPAGHVSPSFQRVNKSNATPYHSVLHDAIFRESPECTNSRSALADRFHAPPVCSFIDSHHHESKRQEMRPYSLGNGKHLGFSPETTTGFDQKSKIERTAFEIGQSGFEYKQTPSCAVNTFPNVALVSQSTSTQTADFGLCNKNNLIKIENTEQSEKSTVCVAVPMEIQLDEEEIIPHSRNNLVKIGTNVKCTHFRKTLLTRSKSPSRPYGISVAKKRKLLDRCKSRLENSDPTFSLDSSSSLLEHLVCEKQKMENSTKRNLEKDKGSISNSDNQITTDSSSGESLEHSISGSVMNDDNFIVGDGVVSSFTMLQENLTENLSKRQRMHILQSTVNGPKSDVNPSCDSKLGSARNSSPSRQLWEKNTGYPNKNPTTKSQILREALTSAPISLRQPSSELTPVVESKRKMNGVLTDAGDSLANSRSGNQVHLTKEQNQNRQTVTCKTPSVTVTASEKSCKPTSSTKHSSQLLLAALTAADNLSSTPALKPVTRQTNSEMLRAALDSSERVDSLNYRSKHSQLLRAALIAVDTNKAIKEKTRETGPKVSNSRLLRAVLTGKYSPETDRFCHSKTSSNPPLPSSQDLSVPSPPLNPFAGNKTVSPDTVKSSVNTGSSRANGHSILRAVLTGALDVPQQSVTNISKGSVPQARRQSRRRRRGELDLKPNPGGYLRNDDYSQSQTRELTFAATVNDNPQTTDIAMKTEQPDELTNDETRYKTDQLQKAEDCVKQREKAGGDECVYCGRVHLSDDTLWLYTSLFASEKQHHFCHVCHQTFSVTCLFLRHVEQHRDAQTKYRCEFCGRYFIHVLSYIMCRLSHLDAQKEKGKARDDGDKTSIECRVKCENNHDVHENDDDNNNNDDEDNVNDFYIHPNNNNNNNNNYKDDDNYKYGKKINEEVVDTDGHYVGESGECKLCKNGLFQHCMNCFLRKTAVDDNDCTRSNVSCEGCTENCRCRYKLQNRRDQIRNTQTARETSTLNSATTKDNHNNNSKKPFQCTACTKLFSTRKELCIHKQLHLDIPASAHHHRYQEKKNASAFQGDADVQQHPAPVLTKAHFSCNSCGALQQRRQKYRTPCLWNNCSGDTAVQLHSDSRCLQLVKD